MDYRQNSDNLLSGQLKSQLLACLDITSEVENDKLAALFLSPVNTDHFYDYYTKVPVQMYIELVVARVQNDYYRSKMALLGDLQMIYENSVKYNGDVSDITQSAKCLVDLI